MAIYRRGKIWWYSFEFQGRRVQESSGFTNKKRAHRCRCRFGERNCWSDGPGFHKKNRAEV